MSVTARNHKKTILFILFVILLGLQVHRFWGGGPSNDSHRHRSRPRLTTQRSLAPPRDPLKLRFDLLEPRKIEVASSRDLFGPGDEEIKEIAPVAVEPVVPDAPLVVEPSEPEAPDVEYVGFVEYAGEKIAFFTRGQEKVQEILMLKTNDQVGDRFKLKDIKADWVTFRNLYTGKEAPLELVEEKKLTPGFPRRSPVQRPLPRSNIRRLPPTPSAFSQTEVAPDNRRRSLGRMPR